MAHLMGKMSIHAKPLMFHDQMQGPLIYIDHYELTKLLDSLRKMAEIPQKSGKN